MESIWKILGSVKTSHGWWKDRKALLMISSTYCPVLHCWVPEVVSYTKGASRNHFAAHFLAVLQSIALEAEMRGIYVTDDLFKNVSLKLNVNI